MDLRYSEQYQTYRREVRDFLSSAWQPTRDKEKITEFRRVATEQGYLYRGIPKVYGGGEQPTDVLKAQIIREEFGRTKAPMEVAGNGMSMLVPTLLDCGADWQKEKFIPKTITGEYLWAQGYSEPGSGSDLASLTTRGELVDGEWIVNGQKIWTTHADRCQYMFALVRTESDAGKHAGISYLLLDLKQPGITIRPIKQINGDAEFCEVFFDNARTPADWIVGERGQGWTVSKSTLKHERNSVGSSSGSYALFRKLVELAQSVERNGQPAIKDPLIRDRIAALEGRVMSHVYTGYFQLTRDANKQQPGIVSLMNKLVTTEIGHEVAAIATDLIGGDALLMPSFAKGNKPGNERWINQILGSLGVSIAGGTSNIQRNIIAERGLGLPRELAENG